jgi:hypothetical protein
VKNAPHKQQVENFWKEIYEKKVQHTEAACWVKNQYQQNSGMERSPVCENDVTEALRATLNCKAPGREQITYFWLKQFTATHKHIAAIFNKLLEADQIPECLTAGITFLIPKNPKDYRPVTVCLQHTNYLHLL